MTENWTYCRSCGERLTSPRAIKWKQGQRCRWAEQERNGTRVYRSTRPRTLGTGVPIDDVKFTMTGKREWVQVKLE